MIKVEHDGVREIVRDWEKSASKGTLYRRAMYAAGLYTRSVLRDDLKRRASVGNVTGRLSRSVKVRLLDTVRGPEADVNPRAFYANVLELGRVIRPKQPGGHLTFAVGRFDGQTVKGGIFRRGRKQMERSAKKAGIKPEASYSKTVRGKHQRGERYYSSRQLRPYRMGMSRNFAEGLKRGAVSIGWVTVEQVTIPAFGFMARAGDEAAPGIAERLGDGFAAQLVRGRVL